VVVVGSTLVDDVVVVGGAGAAVVATVVGAAAFDPPEQAVSTTATPNASTPPTPGAARRRRSVPAVTLVWAVLLIGAALGMLWLATRIEPHWSAPDGSRFTCRVQEIDATGRPTTRWYEARAEVIDGKVAIAKKVLMRRGAAVDARVVSARSDEAPRGQAIYLLMGTPLLAVRVPKKSPAMSRLDTLVN
jgi:hypothetical protein